MTRVSKSGKGGNDNSQGQDGNSQGQDGNQDVQSITIAKWVDVLGA